MKYILGKKLEMSQMFDERGDVIPVTLIEAGPCEVLQIKTKEKDGYTAVQIGFEKRTKNIKKPSAKKPFRWIREYRNDIQKCKIGEQIVSSVFQEGDLIKISGISKGKGFQGGVKRWGFAGKGASHGVKHEARTIGSVGSAFPERVIKGKKMPGRMGFERITVKNLKVAKVDAKNNILAVKGAVPGRRGTLLEIRG